MVTWWFDVQLPSLEPCFDSRRGQIHSEVNRLRRGRDKKPNSVGEGTGDAETESLILWLVVLKLLAGRWWWGEAQSLIQGLLETYFVYLALRTSAMGMGQTVRLGKRNTLFKSGMEIYFYLVLWFFIFYLLFIIFCVKFLQNHQVMVTSLGLCCWPGRRVPQSLDCGSSCNIRGKMREGGENEDKGMVSVIEGVRNLRGRERCRVP